MARAWPPIVFIAVSIGSLFVLRGTSGEWRPGYAIAGIVLLVGALAVGLWLALRPRQGPRHRGLYLALAGMVLWYVLLAAAASVAGGEYVIAALLGAIIPVTALALMVATIRRKTAQTSDGRYVDTTADDSDDPLPGIGMDDATPPGESAELHDLEREDPPDRRYARGARHGADDQ
jgi:hypothetical protein